MRPCLTPGRAAFNHGCRPDDLAALDGGTRDATGHHALGVACPIPGHSPPIALPAGLGARIGSIFGPGLLEMALPPAPVLRAATLAFGHCRACNKKARLDGGPLK